MARSARYAVKASGIDKVVLKEDSELEQKSISIIMEDRIPTFQFSGSGWSGADIRTILVRLPKAYRHLIAMIRKDNAINIKSSEKE